MSGSLEQGGRLGEGAHKDDNSLVDRLRLERSTDMLAPPLGAAAAGHRGFKPCVGLDVLVLA